MKYRHELKYILSKAEMELIKHRLEPLMQRDPHLNGKSYTVRSLYFDDLYDSCLEQVEAGVDIRDKYRIRIYNGNTDVIHLEKKSKVHGMTHKVAENLSAESCLSYMSGNILPGDGAVSRELFCKMLMQGMRAKCIVEYDRDVFIEPTGNVRITFDTDVRGSKDTEKFFTLERFACTQAMPQDMHILEIKYDEFLPEYILTAVNVLCLRQESISKYVYVRYALSH